MSLRSSRRCLLALLRCVIVCGMFSQFAAYCQTATSTIAVAAVVLKVCVATTTPMVFGNYNASSATPTDATATILVICTLGTTYEVALDAGLGSGASTAGRKMTFLTNTLNYQIYRDAGHSLSFGNSSGSDTVSATGSGIISTLTVYGRIPTAQYIGPGAYVDTVTVTVTY
jgi:spore coat protein U-like protein